MTKFVSEVKKISYPIDMVYNVLSDLSNLELLRDKIPDDRVSYFKCDTDSCSFTIDPVGDVRIVVLEREPNSTIKFKSEKLPFDITLWVQFVEKSDEETFMKVTMHADLNMFLKPLVSKPMAEGLEKISDMIAYLPFDEF